LRNNYKNNSLYITIMIFKAVYSDPVYPNIQLHVYELTPFIQTPPFWHGFVLQLSINVSQYGPV
jgi:hypothetical protein